MTESSVTLESSLLRPEQTSRSAQVCEACFLNAATTADILTPVESISISNVTATTSFQTIIYFTAYLVTLVSSSDGLCKTTSGPSIPLSPALRITTTKPADVDSAAFESNITSRFYDYLAFSACSVKPVPVANVLYFSLSTISTDPFPSRTLVSSASNITPSSTTSPVAGNTSPGFTTKDKAATGVVTPVVAIISLVLGILFYLRRRRKRSEFDKHTYESEEETQPYLQQKAELEVEEKRKLELEAVEVRYEMDGRNNRNEMPAQGNEAGNEIDTIERSAMSSLGERHELKGEEHFKELEAP